MKPLSHDAVKDVPESHGDDFRHVREQQIGKPHSAPESKEDFCSHIVQQEIYSCDNGEKDHDSGNLHIPGSAKKEGSQKEKKQYQQDIYRILRQNDYAGYQSAEKPGGDPEDFGTFGSQDTGQGFKKEISLYEIAGAAQKIKESFHTIHEIPTFVKY